MTTYGTIPTQIPALDPSFTGLLKQQIQSCVGTQRPWNEMFQIQSFNFPRSLGQVVERIRTNAAFFGMNYGIIIIFIIFLGLLWNPVSLIVVLIMTFAWLFLYFLRDNESRLIAFGYVIDDRVLITYLFLATGACLFLTDVTKNIVIGLSIGTVVIVAHGALRTTDDLGFFSDDEQRLPSSAPAQAPAPALPQGATLPLRDAASSSFSDP